MPHFKNVYLSSDDGALRNGPAGVDSAVLAIDFLTKNRALNRVVSLEFVIVTYGLPILIAGAFVEEISVVVIAGFLAHQGHFSLFSVCMASFIGSFAGGQILFLFGRKKGREWIAGRPRLGQKVEGARQFLNRNQIWMILGFRYVYGLHTMGPIAMGLSDIPIRYFTWLNTASALIWSVVCSCAGYAFGGILSVFLSNLKRVELQVTTGLAVLGTVAWFVYKVVQKRKSKPGKPDVCSL